MESGFGCERFFVFKFSKEVTANFFAKCCYVLLQQNIILNFKSRTRWLMTNDWSFTGHCSFTTPATPTSMWTFFLLFSTKLPIKSLLQPNHVFRSVMPEHTLFRSVMPEHTLSFLNCRSHFSTDVVLTPLVSRLGSSNSKISTSYQITCILLSFLPLLIRE